MHAALFRLCQNRHRILLYGVGITLAFYTLQLLVLVLRFRQWPNYINVYDWWGYTARIFESTPSLWDILDILPGEWLFEIGFMNYAFGQGISEWSFYFAPVKAVGVVLLSVLVAAIWVLMTEVESIVSPWRIRCAKLLIVGSGTFAGLSSLTLYWVVCCGAPGWAVALGILGVSVPLVLAIEPWGNWLYSASLCTLVLLFFIVVKQNRRCVLRIGH